MQRGVRTEILLSLPPPPHPQKYDAIVASTATIGSIIIDLTYYSQTGRFLPLNMSRISLKTLEGALMDTCTFLHACTPLPPLQENVMHVK